MLETSRATSGAPGPRSFRRLRGTVLPAPPASGGPRRPWAGGRVPPVCVSTSAWLLLWSVSLLTLIRTLSLGLGPPAPGGLASDPTAIPSAETLSADEAPLTGTRGLNTGVHFFWGGPPLQRHSCAPLPQTTHLAVRSAWPVGVGGRDTDGSCSRPSVSASCLCISVRRSRPGAQPPLSLGRGGGAERSRRPGSSRRGVRGRRPSQLRPGPGLRR